MKKEEEIQKLAMQFQSLQNSLQFIKEREAVVLTHIEELQRTKQAIEDLKNIKPNATFIPLGSGNFIKGEIKDTKDIIVGVGGGVAIRKNREDAAEILDSRIKDMDKMLDEISEQAKGIVAQLTEIENKAQEFQKG